MYCYIAVIGQALRVIIFHESYRISVFLRDIKRRKNKFRVIYIEKPVLSGDVSIKYKKSHKQKFIWENQFQSYSHLILTSFEGEKDPRLLSSTILRRSKGCCRNLQGSKLMQLHFVSVKAVYLCTSLANFVVRKQHL